MGAGGWEWSGACALGMSRRWGQHSLLRGSAVVESYRPSPEKENGGWSMQVVALLNEKFGGWTYVISELNLIIHGSIQT